MGIYISRGNNTWSGTSAWNVNGADIDTPDIYPDTDGDTVTILAGHTITFDHPTTPIMGMITVQGTLKMSRVISSNLILSSLESDQIQVAAGGVFDAGTVLDPIPAGVTVTVSIDTTNISKNTDYAGMRRPQQGIRVAYGGLFSAVGDPAHYGGTSKTTLTSDWTSGKSFVVAGDVSGWNSGDKVVVASPWAGLEWDYRTGSMEFTVDTAVHNAGFTTVTVNESFPVAYGYHPFSGRTGFPVVNLSRNVIFKTVGTEWYREPGTPFLDNSQVNYGAHFSLNGGVTVYGDIDSTVTYPNATRAEYVDIAEVEFDHVTLYSGDYKSVNNCSFHKSGGISGMYDVGDGALIPPSLPVQSSKITGNTFYFCNKGVSWHRLCGGVDGSEFTGNMYIHAGAGWHEVYDSIMTGNTYCDCEVAGLVGYCGAVERWWPAITTLGSDCRDNISWCKVALFYGDFMTFSGTVDHCLLGFQRINTSIITGAITNTCTGVAECVSSSFSGNIDIVYCWSFSGHTRAADGNMYNTRSALGYGRTFPAVITSSRSCTFTGIAITSEYCVDIGGIYYWGNRYTETNIFDTCTISCLTLFNEKFLSMWGELYFDTTVTDKFLSCVITQVDDGATPTLDFGVRRLPITVISATSGSNAVEDTYVEFDACTITELFPSTFPATVRPHQSEEKYDYAVYEITCYNGNNYATTYQLSKAVRITGEGDYLARVEKFHGTLQDTDMILNNNPAPDPENVPTLSVIATPKTCDNPAKAPMAFRVLELIETGVPATERVIRAYAKLDANWVVPPTAAQLRLEVEYPTDGLGVTTAYSTETVTEAWTGLTVTYTPGVVGTVRTRLVLYAGDEAASVIVDPAFYEGQEG